jgi:hypothetical protein
VTIDDRIRDVLARLQMLADGDTQNLDPDKRFSKHAESKPPAGLTYRPSDKPPPKDRVSLFEWYSWQFRHHADDPEKLAVLVDLAEDDYRDFRFKADHRIELRKGELLDNDPRDGGSAEEAQARRIIEWYEGRDPLYVAWTESRMGAKVSEEWVRKARRQHERNPEDGRPRSEFLAMDADRRREAVAAQAAKGKGKKAAAKALGVNPDTVRRYWPEEAVAA